MVPTVITFAAIAAMDTPQDVQVDNCFGGDTEQPRSGSTPQGWVSVEDLGDIAYRPLDEITDIGPDDSELADKEPVDSNGDWDQAVAKAIARGCYSASPRTPNHAQLLDQARSSAQKREFVPARVDLYAEPITDVSGINYLAGSPSDENSDRWTQVRNDRSITMVLTTTQLARLRLWNASRPHQLPKRISRAVRGAAKQEVGRQRFNQLAADYHLTPGELVKALGQLSTAG